MWRRGVKRRKLKSKTNRVPQNFATTLMVTGLVLTVVFGVNYLLTIWKNTADSQTRVEQNLSQQAKCDNLLKVTALNSDTLDMDISSELFNCSPETVAALKSLQNTKHQAVSASEEVDVSKQISDTLMDGNKQSKRAGDTLTEVASSLQKQNMRAEQFARENLTCQPTSWKNSEGVVFKGCDNLLAGDVNQWEWKTWEEALRDGDLCIRDDELTGKQVAEVC